MEGWVKLHRQLRAWEWYDDSKTVHLWLHLLLKANHKKAKWRGVEILPGQFVTSREKLSSETGISQQSVRSILKRFTSTNQIVVKSTNRFTMITICEWETYQSDDEDDQPATNQQSTSN